MERPRPLSRKRLVDILGYASLVPFFMFYNYLEQKHDDWRAIAIALLAWSPCVAAWHFYYARYSGSDC